MSNATLQRKLGLWTTISIVAGGIIGSGIFVKPALMAGQLGSPKLLLLVWIVAGVITMFGALTNAEVAAMIPETGGQYIFFQKMYGDFIAFLYGWAAFSVFNTAGVASIAYVMAQYLEYFIQLPRFPTAIEQGWSLHIPFIGTIFPLENAGVKGATILTVILLTMGNYISVRFAGSVQVLFTALKIIAIGFLVGGIFLSGNGSYNNFFHASALMPEGRFMINAIVAATAGAFWAYDGWNNITFVAGEIKNPQTNIPKSLFIGIAISIILYALVNLAYIYVLPIEKMAASPTVAADAARVMMGSAGGAFIALLVIFSTFGSTNGNILATTRVSFAMAKQNRFFSFAGKVHPRFQTPGNALLLHGVWTCLLVCSGSFDMLTDILIFITWLFYGMSAAGIFILRIKYPDAERPYKVWGYPVVPFIFCAFTFVFLVITLYNDINNYLSGRTQVINAAFGLALTFFGFPLYLYYRWRGVSMKN